MTCIRSLAVALVAAAALAGCGNTDGDGGGGDRTAEVATTRQEGRPVTDAQALVLARVLQQNWQRGGATFTGSVDVQGVRIPMNGRVDFRNGRGTATLREPNAAARRYVWTRRAVYAQAAPGSRRYTRQPPNPDGDPVHATIALVNLLSAETIDNTANIRDQGARYLGTGTVDGTPVDTYRYGRNSSTTYEIDRDDGLLRRLDARHPTGQIVVTLTSHRPVRVGMPPSGG